MFSVLKQILASPEEVPAHPAEGGVRLTPGERLWFVWFAMLTLSSLAFFSVCAFVHYHFRPTARTFKRWAGRWGRLALRGSGLRVELEQRAALDADVSCVFVANHQNTLDILALAGYLPVPFGFVAKAGLEDVPFLGLALRHSPSLFVDRSNPRRSVESIRAAGRSIREGTAVLVFAEGVRAFGPHLLPFKKGAFILAVEAGVPIVPVTLVDAWRCLDERHFAGRPGVVRVVAGTPIPTAGTTRRDVPALMEAVRTQMEDALGAEEQQQEAAVS